jgi:hypothetical protein
MNFFEVVENEVILPFQIIEAFDILDEEFGWNIVVTFVERIFNLFMG